MQNHSQADRVIGVIGSVSNGKSTIVKTLTNIVTQRHKKEKESNKTIRVGYANAKFFKCISCPAPQCYQSTESYVNECVCKHCGNLCEFKTHTSFTDVPGHNIFMETMLNGTCAMDYAIMIESCENEQIPSQQTIEHYNILRRKGIKTIAVCLNKVDQMSKSPKKVKKLMENLRQFIFQNEGHEVIVIPVSGTMNCNIDILMEYICKTPLPEKDVTSNPKLFAIRSFNVNLPRTQISQIKGGVMGGCLQRGTLRVGDELILSPCYPTKIVKTQNETNTENNDSYINWTYSNISCKVLSIDSEKVELDYAIPGGLIGVQLNIDPALTASDGMVGNVLFKECEKEKYKVYEGVKIAYEPIKNVELTVGSVLQINSNANNVKCTIFDLDDKFLKLELEKPICVEVNDLVTVSMSIAGNGINIVACGKIVGGIESKQV